MSYNSLKAYCKLRNHSTINLVSLLESEHVDCVLDLIEEFQIDLSEEWLEPKQFGPFMVSFHNMNFAEVLGGLQNRQYQKVKEPNSIIRLLRVATKYRWKCNVRKWCIQLLSEFTSADCRPKSEEEDNVYKQLVATLLDYYEVACANTEYKKNWNEWNDLHAIMNADRMGILPRVLQVIFGSKLPKSFLKYMMTHSSLYAEKEMIHICKMARAEGCILEWSGKCLANVVSLELARFCISFFHVDITKQPCKGCEYYIRGDVCSHLLMLLMKCGVDINVDQLVHKMEESEKEYKSYKKVDLSNREFRAYLRPLILSSEYPNVYKAICEVDKIEKEISEILCGVVNEMVVKHVLLDYVEFDKYRSKYM